MAVVAAPPTGGPATSGGGGSVPPNAFTRASRQHTEPILDTIYTPGDGAQDLGSFEVPPFGFLRDIIVLVEATGAVKGANSPTFMPDAPYSALSLINFHDVNSQPLYGPINGYNGYLAHKYGGYLFSADPADAPSYAVDTVNGNFSYLFKIPSEIVARNGLGSLANGNASSTYRLDLTAAGLGAIYATNVPATLPQVRIRAWAEEWTQPFPQDALGRPNEIVPPGLGTTQFWSAQIWNVANGQNTPRIQRVGNYIRNILMVTRDGDGARTNASFPDPTLVMMDGRMLHNAGRGIFRQWLAERYGYAANRLDTGVYALDFTHDFDGHPGGGDMTDLWLPTTQATRLELQGVFSVEGTIEFLINDVAASANSGG